MSFVIAFFCAFCFLTLADSVADYISAKAEMIKAQAEALGVQSKLKEWQAEKGEEISA